MVKTVCKQFLQMDTTKYIVSAVFSSLFFLAKLFAFLIFPVSLSNF